LDAIHTDGLKALGAVISAFEAEKGLFEPPAVDRNSGSLNGGNAERDQGGDEAAHSEEEFEVSGYIGEEDEESSHWKAATEGQQSESGNIHNWLSQLGDSIVNGPNDSIVDGPQADQAAVGEKPKSKDEEARSTNSPILSLLTQDTVEDEQQMTNQQIETRRRNSSLCAISLNIGAGAYATEKVLSGGLRRAVEKSWQVWKDATFKKELTIEIGELESVQEERRRRVDAQNTHTRIDEEEEDSVPEFSHAFERYSVLIVLLYILLSAATIYLLEKHSSQPLDYFESLYFIVITLTTVGYGNYVPKTPAGKIFICFFEMIGLSIVAAALGALMSQLINATRTERQENAAASSPVSPDLQSKQWGKEPDMGRALLDTDESTASAGSSSSMVQTKSIGYWISSLAKPLTRMAVMSACGTIFMCAHNHMQFVDGFYWSIITLTSVGYGDITPTDTAGKAFTLVYAIVGVGVFGDCLGRFVSLWVEMEDERKVQAFIKKGVTRQTIREIDNDADAEVGYFLPSSPPSLLSPFPPPPLPILLFLPVIHFGCASVREKASHSE
jgi:hypothetical protein